MAKKRTQGKVKFFNLSDMYVKAAVPTLGSVVHVDRQVEVLKDGTQVDLTEKSLSESRLIRKFGAENFAVVTVDKEATPLVLDYVLLDGFVFEGKVYKRVLRSASQMRTAKAVFTCLDVDMVREAMVYGATFAKNGKVNIAKKEARYGLALSSTIEVDVQFTHKVIPDFYREIQLEGRRMNDEGVMVDFKEVENLNMTDGQGYIDYPTAKKIAKELQLSYVPTAFQVRFAGAKGLLIVWKWDKKQHPENILFHDSMWKYDPDFSKYSPKLEIADWAKPSRSQYVNLCYQFIQILDITGEELIEMSKETLKTVESGVLTKPEVAMKFLGMIDTTEGEYNEKVVSRLQKTLDADPTMLEDAYVQKSIRHLLKKFITDMRKGRVPVLGAWRYVACDPTVVFGKEEGVLAAGEVYYNNQSGKIGAFRSPLIHSSEAVVFNMTEDEGFASMVEADGFVYLKDLLVLNSHDDAAPRMGGMDKDGDRVLITADERVIKGIRGGKLIYDAGRDGQVVADTKENLILYDKATFTPSRIGIITDWATIWTDASHHKNAFHKYDENIQVLRVLQGQEIDAAKTGYTPEIPEHLQLKIAPHWMEKNIDKGTMKFKSSDKQIKQYHSNSPIGQLYDFIVGTSKEMLSKYDDIYRVDGYWAQFIENIDNSNQKRSLGILMGIDRVEASSIYNYVASLERMYRSELAALREMDDKFDEEDMQDARNLIFEKYTELMDNIDADPRTVAGVAYQIAYTDNGSKKRSVSFPWICAFDGLLMLLSNIADKRYKLVPVRGENLTAGDMKFSNKKCKSTGAAANVPNGTHEVVEIEGRFFAKVKRTAAPQTEGRKTRQAEKVAFTLRGFKHSGFTATTAMAAVKAAGGEIILAKEGEYIYAYADGTRIAAVGCEDDFTAVMLMNKRLKVTNTPQTKFMSQRTHKLEERGSLDIQAEIIEEVELVLDNAIADEFNAQFQSFGFESVEPVLFDEPQEDGAVGVVKIAFKGKTYAYRFGAHQGVPVIMNHIKSDEIRNTLVQYLNSTYDFIA